MVLIGWYKNNACIWVDSFITFFVLRFFSEPDTQLCFGFCKLCQVMTCTQFTMSHFGDIVSVLGNKNFKKVNTAIHSHLIRFHSHLVWNGKPISTERATSFMWLCSHTEIVPHYLCQLCRLLLHFACESSIMLFWSWQIWQSHRFLELSLQSLPVLRSGIPDIFVDINHFTGHNHHLLYITKHRFLFYFIEHRSQSVPKRHHTSFFFFFMFL